MKYNGNNFDEWWNSLSGTQKENIKELVIARLKTLPPDLKICIG